MKLRSIKDLDGFGGIQVALMGMSGVGKTHIAQMLRKSGAWYHYSVDYRLGRQYLTPHIDDILRARAMKDKVFARLLRADAMSLKSKISIANLDVLTEYLGKIGNPHKGGLTLEEFLQRQEIHGQAEIAAMADADLFLHRARSQYGYPNFVCDCSGSVCSIVDPDNSEDPVLSRLAAKHILIYLDTAPDDMERLIERFRRQPKPIFYSVPFFQECARAYLQDGQSWDQVDPDTFAEWAFERIVTYRLPRFRAIADGWGFTVPPGTFDGVKDSDQFLGLLDEILQQS